MTVVRLASSREHVATRACCTCAHRRRDTKCGALGRYQQTARQYAHLCGPDGRLWEARPPRTRGVIERLWRYLFGGTA